eukprot:6184497-Pleurochrysis_carterae.AAC.2
MMPTPPVALETSRPNGRRSEGVRTFWYGPAELPSPETSRSHRTRLRRARRGYRLCLYLLVRTQTTPHRVTLSRTTTTRAGAGYAGRNRCCFGELIIHSARYREAPFGSDKERSDVPLALSSEVGT